MADGHLDARVSPRFARVWDPLVRIFHWSLVTSILIAWLSPGIFGDVHEAAGFAALGLICLRIVWGLFGSRYARFSQFLRPPKAIIAYLRDIRDARESRYLGHNPAGGAMIVALLLMTIATASSGWMMVTDTFFGIVWVEVLHKLTSHLLMLMVVAHLVGVLLASWRHHENLVRAMITGRKRPAADVDVA